MDNAGVLREYDRVSFKIIFFESYLTKVSKELSARAPTKAK